MGPLVCLALAATWLAAGSAAATPDPPRYGYRVVERYPHDPGASTQGLVYDGGRLYESAGGWGTSTLREVDLASGQVLRVHALPDTLYAEGLTLWEGRLVQLTWRARQGLVYDPGSFAVVGTFPYATEGWGLTHDGRRLLMTDGSDRLYALDPDTYAALGSVRVQDGLRPVRGLNALAYVRGLVYANVLGSHLVAMIEPEGGAVRGWLDLTGLSSEPADFPNGMAYDAERGRLFVTGKNWPGLYHIEVVPVGD